MTSGVPLTQLKACKDHFDRSTQSSQQLLRKLGNGLFSAGLLTLLALIVGCSLVARPRPPETTVKNNKMVFSLPDLTGKIVSSEDEQFKGKVVVVDIWGSWCPPCRVELPHLVRLYEKYHDQGLEIVGLSFERGPQARQLESLKEFVKDNDMDYTVLYGGSTSETRRKLPAVENFRGYPTTIFIGRDGGVKKVEVGFADRMAPEMEETIQELLGAE